MLFASIPTPRFALVAALMFASVTSAFSQSGIRATSSTPTVDTRGVSGIDPAARPEAPPIATPAEAPAVPLLKEESALRFRIKRVRFAGNQVIRTAELRTLARGIEEKTSSLADLTQLRKRIRSLYQSRGYFLARVTLPPQISATGEVTIEIYEGHYGDLYIEGNSSYTTRFIERFFRPAFREGVVRQKAVQRSLLLLNEFPDLTVTSVFKKGKKKGTADLVLKVQDSEPLHATLEYNDYGTRRLGRSRVGLAINGNNVFTDGDEAFGRATYLLPRTSDPLFQTSYTAPIGEAGDRLSLSYSNSAVVLGADVAVLDIRGDAEIYGLTFQRPWLREVNRSANLTLGFVLKSVQNAIFGEQLISQDDLALVTVSADGQLVRGSSRILSSATLTQGLGTLFGGVESGARFPDGTLRASREGAGNEMGKGNADVFFIRRVSSADFLLIRAGGQVVTHPLPVVEQFGLGGPDSVRGYLQSEFLGDEGYALSAEYRHSVYAGKASRSQFVLFLDHGHASLKLPRAGEQATRTLRGMGTGLRLALGSHLNVRVDLGFPLTGPNNEALKPVIYGQLTNRW